jgi:hypothetical protein
MQNGITPISSRAISTAARCEEFIRGTVIPYENNPRRDAHGPLDSMIIELREKARAAGVLTLHILEDGSHLSQRETAIVLKKTGLSLLGPHAVLRLEDLHLLGDSILGEVHQGFRHAQVRLSPARLSHCMRGHGAATRGHEIATEYACRREAFGKKLIDHEGIGFQLADNLIDLKQAELMIDWSADVLDSGALGTSESSMAKVAVSDALFRVADRCARVMGGTGVTRDTMVEQVFREIRAFRIYDGPTEVHKWSLAKKIKREAGPAQ